MLFTNLRVMIESEDVIEHYFGPHGYGYGFTPSNNVYCLYYVTVIGG